MYFMVFEDNRKGQAEERQTQFTHLVRIIGEYNIILGMQAYV